MIYPPVQPDAAFNYNLTYYLSGPMAGYPNHNFEAFETTVQILRDSGIDMLSPHEVDHPLLSGKPEEWHHYLRNDLTEMLKHCNGIIMMKGWPQSNGAKLEMDVALKLGWPVYYYEDFTLINMNKESDNERSAAQLASTG